MLGDTMPRYKLTIEYDGRNFVGWQRQENGPSVQQALERAVARFCGETVNVFAAGRTDAGVHALGQVAHFEIDRGVRGETVRDALNFHLKPAPVVVVQAEPVSADFHARFSARERTYLYRITNRRAPPALERGRTWWVPTPLDVPAMAAAARALIGRHDFTSFRASICQAASPVKTLDAVAVARDGDEIRIEVRARSFLHHQVRNIVGTLRRVGEGKWTAADVAAILAARDRCKAGPTAPAEGLYLVSVTY
jgi:tRNA pseudouridine38-40 synthase